MAAEEKTSGFCKYCNSNVVVSRPGTNHILHLLLTIITAGLWLIVWVGISVKIGGWRCSVCGKTASGSAAARTIPSTRKCPHCAEMINAEATKCRFCQSGVTPTQTAKSIAHAKKEQGKDNLVGWSVIAVVVIIIVIFINAT